VLALVCVCHGCPTSVTLAEKYRSTKVSRSASAPLLQRLHVNTVFSSRAFSAAALAVGSSLDINARSAETFLNFSA